MKKSKILLPLTLAFVATASGAIAASSVKATADSSFKMVEGASIRVNQTDGKYGIKFAANVGTPVEGATYNMMIVPVEYVEAYNAIETEGKKDLAAYMLDAKAANEDMPLAIATDLEVNDKGNIEGSIVDIRWENLTAQFVGAAYYTTEDSTVTCAITATDGTRSVVDVAVKAIQSNDYAENETVTNTLKGFVYNAIQAESGVAESEKAQEGKEAKISFAETDKSVYVGDEITVNYAPYVAAELANWTSSDVSVATVDNGKINALKEGTTTIEVKLLDLTASYTLEVKTPAITGAKVEGATVSWDPIDGATYVVSLNGAAQTAQTENTFTLTADGIYTITVKATKNGVTSEETTVATNYYYNADGITYGGAKSFSFTELTNEKGSFTIEANTTSWQHGAAVTLAKLQSNEFLKVGFTVTSDGYSMMNSGLAIGMRGNKLTQGATDRSSLAGGGYFAEWYESYMRAGSGSTFFYSDHENGKNHETNVVKGNSTSLSAGDYYMLSGVMTKNNNTTIFSALLNSRNQVIKFTSWDATEAGIGSVAESGYFSIYYYGTGEATFSYEVVDDPSEYLQSYDKPIVKYADGKLSWNMVSWAEGYKLSLDGGDTWQNVDAVNHTLSAYGLYDVQLKAYRGEQESVVATLAVVYTKDDISFASSYMKDISFTTLDHQEGSITYTNTGTGRETSGISLNKNYTDEWIKVTFTSMGNSMASNGISLGLRGLTNSQFVSDPLYTGGWRVFYDANNEGYFSTCYTDATKGFANTAQYMMNGSNPVHEVLVSQIDLRSGLVEGEEYSYVFGAEGKNENTTVYFGVLKDDNVLKLYKWEWKKIADKYAELGYTSFPEIPESGSFRIWNSYQGERTISYEIVSRSDILEKVNVARATSVAKNTLTDGTQEITFTSATAEGTTIDNNYAAAASVYFVKQYANEFVKVGFTAKKYNTSDTNVTMTSQGFSIGLRNSSFAGGGSTSSINRIMFAGFGSHNISFSVGSAQNYAQNSPYGSSFSLNNITEGSEYTMLAGMVTEEGKTTIYFILNEVVDGVEVLKKICTWDYDNLTNKPSTLNESGYIEVLSYAPGERTITYKIVDFATVNSTYLSQITA